MLRNRLIPVLLKSGNALVKTFGFKDPKYIGDPLNTIRIFNEKSVDEICLFDISKKEDDQNLDIDFLERVASETSMPVCYGGGIRSCSQGRQIVSSGIEKISVCSSYFKRPGLITELADSIGSQSVVVTLNINYDQQKHFVSDSNGIKVDNQQIEEHIEKVQKLGAGEIIFNFIQRDGMLCGFDYEFIKKFLCYVKTPCTVVGGCSGLADIEKLSKDFNFVGIGVGSHFVLKGKFKAVLIQYPTYEEKLNMTKQT